MELNVRLLAITTFVLGIFLTAGAGLLILMDRGPLQQISSQLLSKPSTRIVHSAYYSLKLTTYRFPMDGVNGGAIVPLEGGLLIAGPNGDMAFFRRDVEELLPLPYRTPINKDEFVSYIKTYPYPVEPKRFRVTDLLLDRNQSQLTLFVLHQFWHEDRACVVMRLSRADAGVTSFLSGDAALTWQTLFETSPCLPLLSEYEYFNGHIGGSSMIRLPDSGKLLLAIGDFRFDGLASPALAQDPEALYGKVIEIDPETGRFEIHSTGVRNPQGLHMDMQGTIWETEQGPQGGDELNLIRKGANYGWPDATYGTQYGSYSWPMTVGPGNHEGYDRPVHAWLPSIGTAGLTSISSDLFPRWKSDLMIGTLRATTLFRMHIRDGAVIVSEPIPIGRRIRKVVEDQSGALALWVDGLDLVIVEPVTDIKDLPQDISDQETGKYLFAGCKSCHATDAEAPHGIGPNLWQIMERDIASADGYAYSKGLADRKGRWTVESMDAFLADPQHFAPGNTMSANGLENPSDRSMVIKYLQTLR